MRVLYIFLLLSVVLSKPAYAGFFDFLFGGNADNATKQEAAPAGPPTPKFGGQMMNGAQLMGELRTLKAGLASPNPMSAFSQLLMPAETKAPEPAKAAKGKQGSRKAQLEAEQLQKQQGQKDREQRAAAQNKPDSGKAGGLDAIGSLVSLVNDVLVNKLSSQLSYQGMEKLFGMLVDQPDALQSVYVEVPELSNLTPDLRKKTLSMAAFLVALKASGKVIDASQKDFDAAKASYARIMEIRQKAAQVLADAYFKRNQAASLQEQAADAQAGGVLGPREEAFLSNLGAAKPEDLVRNPQVQAVALSTLKQYDPATYGRYVFEFEEMKSHYNGYSRGVVGASSLVGFSFIFAGQAAAAIKKQPALNGLALLPLIQQAIPECLALAPRMMKMYSSGDEAVSGSFSIEKGGMVEKRGLSAAKVVSNLDPAARQALSDNLATNGTKGLLANLHLVSPALAATLADKYVQKDTKAALAQHFASDRERFSFVDAQAGKCGSQKSYKHITQALFFQRQRDPDNTCKGESAEQALMLAQRDLREGLGSLENGDLRKIMYAASTNPSDITAPLALGETRVRIDNLGMDGLLDQQAMLENRISTHATEKSYKNEGAGKRALKRKS